jgi:hypothetical protein
LHSISVGGKSGWRSRFFSSSSFLWKKKVKSRAGKYTHGCREMPAACNTNLTIIIIYTVIRSNPIHVSHRRRSAAAIRRDCILREAIESVVVGQILSFSFPAQLTCWIDDGSLHRHKGSEGGKPTGLPVLLQQKEREKKRRRKEMYVT